MKDTNLKAWITYEYLHIQEFDRDGGELDSMSFEEGEPVEVLCWLPPSYVSYKNAWRHGLFLVRNKENQEYIFDGQFISFINPNTEELN
ncbi:hypothetical protein [Bacillus sp. TH13]|uniref:hypothetical protein n=1 Tax=Bacillus sp. TH13 TaxID=2796379 RepID=UPI001912CB44|nr:hypothetical protein [Bacillus sp. TH13]MBK5492582.1 hypothetical protein [Bacillus sp. TH13]